MNVNFPVSDGVYTGMDAAYFRYNRNEGPLQLLPLLLCYPYTPDRSGMGVYREPIGGLAFGDPDVLRFEKGVTAGLCGGYYFSGNPAFNRLSLRLSHPLSLRKRDA